MAEMKKCKKCETDKAVSEFYCKDKKTGRIDSSCKKCHYFSKDRSKKYPKPALYMVWAGMKARCDNPNNPRYNRYGGRGITYCSAWKDYKVFEQDMLNDYKKGLQLDRVDNDGNYCPANCKWSTPREQSNNRSDNKYFRFNGKKQTLPAWARELGVNRSTLAQRYYGLKWPIEKVLTYNITHT